MKRDKVEILLSHFAVIPDLDVYSGKIIHALISSIAEVLQSLAGVWYSVLRQDITDDSKYIFVENGNTFPENGLVMVDIEYIAYVKEGDSLQITQRGCLNSTITDHREGSVVVLVYPYQNVSQIKSIFQQTIHKLAEGMYLDTLVEDRNLQRNFQGYIPNDPTLRRIIPVLYLKRGTLPVVVEGIRRCLRHDYPRLFVTTHPNNYEVLIQVYDEPFRELDKVEAWEYDPTPLPSGDFYIPSGIVQNGNIIDSEIGGYFAESIYDILPLERSLYLPLLLGLQVEVDIHHNIDDPPDYYPSLRWLLPYGCGLKFVKLY